MSIFDGPVSARQLWWIIGVVGAIAGGTLAIDARYAKASEVTEAKTDLKREIAANRTFVEAAFLQQRRTNLQDKLFELEAKRDERKISPVELKQLFRYRSEIEDVNRDLEAKQQKIR